MSYGPVALAEAGVIDPAPEGAPTIEIIQPANGGSYTARVTMPPDSDVVGATLCWAPRNEANPFVNEDGSTKTLEEIKGLDGVTVHNLIGGPGEVREFSESWPDSLDNGDVVVFACAATDDSDDLQE